MKELLKLADACGFKPRTLSTKWTYDSIIGNKTIMKSENPKKLLINDVCESNLLNEINKWLREKHPEFSLHCVPNETDDYGWHSMFFDDITIRPQSSYPKEGWIESDYGSYEESLEKGLVEILKLLKNNNEVG